MIVNHKYFNHQVFQSWEEYFNNPNNTKFSGFQHSPLTGYPFVCVSFARFQRITSGCIRVFDICDPRVMIENTIFFHCTHPVNGVCIFMNSTSGGQILMRYVCADYCYTTGSPIGQGQFCFIDCSNPTPLLNTVDYVSACECAPYFPEVILQQYTFIWKIRYTKMTNMNISNNNCHTYAGITLHNPDSNCSISFLTLYNNTISLWCCFSFHYGTNNLNYSNIMLNSQKSSTHGIFNSFNAITTLYQCHFSENNTAYNIIFQLASTLTLIDCSIPVNLSIYGQIFISNSHTYYPTLFTNFITYGCNHLIIVTPYLVSHVVSSFQFILCLLLIYIT